MIRTNTMSGTNNVVMDTGVLRRRRRKGRKRYKKEEEEEGNKRKGRTTFDTFVIPLTSLITLYMLCGEEEEHFIPCQLSVLATIASWEG